MRLSPDHKKSMLSQMRTSILSRRIGVVSFIIIVCMIMLGAVSRALEASISDLNSNVQISEENLDTKIAQFDNDIDDEDDSTDDKDDHATASSSRPSAYQPFNSTNPHANSWCPHATCQNSPLCAPCNRRYIIILATGRSGSTTLLKMMNYLPNVRLAGENRNFIGVSSSLITNFQRLDTFLEDSDGKSKPTSKLLEQNEDRVDGAFQHNAIPPQAMSCPIQNALNTLNPPPKEVQEKDNVLSIQEYDRETIMGCKTIRFHKTGLKIDYAADYIKEVFPCSKIIVNIRTNVTSQLESINNTFNDAAAEESGKTIEEIEGYNHYLMSVAEKLGSDMARVIDMVEWKSNVGVLNDVVHWLGFRGCEFKNIVHENINGLGRDHETDVGLDENNCHYPH